MNNILAFKDGYKAVISYDSDIELLRGEFIGLNGGADFYAKDIQGLKKEGAASLEIFLEECKARHIEPKKKEGKFALRLDPDLYTSVIAFAKAKNMSINSFIADSLREYLSLPKKIQIHRPFKKDEVQGSAKKQATPHV